MRRPWKWSTQIFKLIKVTGDSMSPALEDGDYVLIKKPRSYRPGSIYVIYHTDLGRIVKRLKSVENGSLIFNGDNPSSTPEAVIAPVSQDRVSGQAWLRISKTGMCLL